jgi:eukaryotic-like serine/threonine-protein kinase
MTSIVSITAVADTVTCPAGGSVEHAFNVTNSSGAALSLGARVLADKPAQEGWFAVGGKAERDLADQATDQITVAAQVPKDAAPGKYTFRLLVFSMRRPGEDFTEGPTVAIEVPAPDRPVSGPTPPPPFPWWIVAVVAAVLVLAIGGGATWWLMRPPKVPELVGLTLDAAVAKLKESKLAEGEIREEITGGASGGVVIRQDPAAGAKVDKGAAVKLVIEAVSIEVPKVIGKGVVEAKQTLAAAGLAVGDIKEQRTGGAPGGSVLGQNPEPGKRVAPQAAVALTVEAESIPVPSVVGQTLAEATRTLGGRGLLVGEVKQRRTGGTPGVVLSQDPNSGAVPPGTAVTLIVEQQTIPVPGVKNMSLEDAMRELVNKGLKVGAVTKVREGGSPGTVLRQDPAKDANVDPGTPVALVVEDQPPPPPKVYRRGRLSIGQTFTADLDEGQVGAGATSDIWFEAETATRRFLAPQNKAQIAAVGRQSVGRDGCAKAALGSAKIPIETLPAGSYVCVRTNQGRYSELRVMANVGPSPGKLDVEYTTWEASFVISPHVLEILREHPIAVQPLRPR